MDWLIQEAAKDLVNVEEDAMGEEHGGERREVCAAGEGEEEEQGARAGEGEGEETGGALMEITLPDEGLGEKQGRALGIVSGEIKPPSDKGVGEAA